MQPLVDIEAVVLAIITEPVVQTDRHFLGGCRHCFQRIDDGESRILDGDNITKTGANAENPQLTAFWELPPAFVDQDLTRVVAPKAGIDELDLIPAELDGLKESGCR